MSTRIRRNRGVPQVLDARDEEAASETTGPGAGRRKTAKSAAPKKSSSNHRAKRARTSPSTRTAGAARKTSTASRKKPARRSTPQPELEFTEAPADAPPKRDASRKTRRSPAKGKGRSRTTADKMAEKQREISVSEFFTKNRHLLGFDSPARALLTTVKEAVDNSLDACEEAGILPELHVELHEVADDRFRVIVEDNGPGIVKAQVPKVFGKLLYGSKFHRLRQSRGQQGIGISAAGMYGQLTTGRPVVITSKTNRRAAAHHFEIVIDTARNAPQVVADRTVEWDRDHGTRLEIELQGTYKGGRRSVDEYLEQVAIANPHATIHYQPPRGKPPVHLPRAAQELPREPEEIKPHPYGVELGTLQRLLKDTKARTLSAALQQEFSRVSARVAERIAAHAALSPRARPRALTPGEVERLHQAIPKVRIIAPPASCVVPIGEDLIRRGLEREIQADFYTSATRPPAVYRGNPFQVEAGLAYGGELRDGTAGDETLAATERAADAQHGPIRLLRLANRVPLQYQQSACATFKGTVDTNWRQYGLSQPRGSLPQGPMVLLVHIASVWVPFTSESKEAVAHYPEILKEIRLALQECGRRLGTWLRKREHAKREERRRSIFAMYIGELVEALGNLTNVDRRALQQQLEALAGRHTDGDTEAVAAAAGTRAATRKRVRAGKQDAS